jgi:hypothetical protein
MPQMTCLALPLHWWRTNSFLRLGFIQHHVIKDQKALGTGDHLPTHVLPDQARLNLISNRVAVDRLMPELFGVVRKIRQGVIDLTAQQKLAVIQTTHFAFRMIVHFSIMLRNKIRKLSLTGTQIAVHGRQQRGDGQ